MLKFFVVFSVMFGISSGMFADKRPYVWTYPYMLGHPGAIELEHYLTYSISDLYSASNTVSVVHQVEIETGITPYWDIGIYQIFKQSPAGSGSLKYDSFKLRTRFALAGKDEFVMDPLLYLELKSSADISEFEGEIKLILSKDILPGVNVALNPYYAVKFGPKILTEQSFKFAAGVSYAFTEWFSLSGEFRVSVDFLPAGPLEKVYVGPTVLIGKGDIRWTFGASFRVFSISTSGAEFRSLLGFYF
ncbi:MAG: hypothetical protein A2Y33_13490 [Spirochaetes bacterium GWF1_51_8]|nr:MAG: hypothetical protein A2Y33_13490 [Spirochaetes bacterium GWF1_51_8]